MQSDKTCQHIQKCQECCHSSSNHKQVSWLLGGCLSCGKSIRYNIKGKKYINTLAKYYFSDLGIRNALLGFRQQEETHIMENIIYNELRTRGFHVDVGMVETREPDKMVD